MIYWIEIIIVYYKPKTKILRMDLIDNLEYVPTLSIRLISRINKKPKSQVN